MTAQAPLLWNSDNGPASWISPIRSPVAIWEQFKHITPPTISKRPTNHIIQGLGDERTQCLYVTACLTFKTRSTTIKYPYMKKIYQYKTEISQRRYSYALTLFCKLVSQPTKLVYFTAFVARAIFWRVRRQQTNCQTFSQRLDMFFQILRHITQTMHDRGGLVTFQCVNDIA